MDDILIDVVCGLILHLDFVFFFLVVFDCQIIFWVSVIDMVVDFLFSSG
jgi:hypothetical protein